MTKTTRKIQHLYDVDVPLKSINASVFVTVDAYETAIVEINRSLKYAITTVEVGSHVLEGCGSKISGAMSDKDIALSLRAWLYESGFDADKNAASRELADIILDLIDEIENDI